MQFQGEFNQTEMDFMVEWFLNSMLERGALPFASVTPDNQSKFVFNDENTTTQ